MRSTSPITRKLIYPICLIFASASMSATTLDAQARELTTFEDYAKMSKDQQGEILGYVFQKMLEKTYNEKDTKRRNCLENKFLSKYGDAEKVKRVHGLLKGNLAHAIENTSPDGRVEYLIANYMIELCPKSTVNANN